MIMFLVHPILKIWELIHMQYIKQIIVLVKEVNVAPGWQSIWRDKEVSDEKQWN